MGGGGLVDLSTFTSYYDSFLSSGSGSVFERMGTGSGSWSTGHEGETLSL